jgi:hypothetical protein
MKNKRSVTAGVMIITVLAVIVIVVSRLIPLGPAAQVPTATNTNPPAATQTPDLCAQENIAASVTGLEKASRAFDDQINIARGTANAQLAPIIADLQKNRRDVDDYQVPPCLDTLKAQLMGYMNAYVDFYLLLYSSASVAAPGVTQKQFNQAMATMSVSANQRYSDVVDYANKFVIEKAHLLGLTPPATVPTAMIVGTPGTPSPIATP